MPSPCKTATTVAEALRTAFTELDAVFLLPDELLLLTPDYPDAWSISSHLEHVSLANHFLLLTIAKGCRKAVARAKLLPVPEGESDLTPLSPIALPGAFDWPPPRHMIPTGTAPLEEVRTALAQQHRTCRDLLARIPAGEGRLCTLRMSVHRLDRLDMYQWLFFLAQHIRYHLTLINGRFPRHNSVH